MINPNITPQVIHSETPTHTINMSEMDAESISFMLSQSRDGFYSNKELAPIREYSTNAMDAHIQSGIPERPIEITLPSQFAPELKIRDFGDGLSESQLEEIYFKYWKSTKRNTNEQTGFFGIGSKSAMAYSDIYTIISICDDKKMVYTAHKNGLAQRIYNGENIDREPSGIEVIIPVQQKDIQKFITEALDFFQYWEIKPIFKNIEDEKVRSAFSIMESKPFLSGDGWSIRPSGYGQGKTVAVMANVAYSIDWSQVRNSVAPEIAHKISGIYEFLEQNITTLYFPNGTLAFTPNRESLQYNEATVIELSKKLVEIYNNLLSIISEKISDAATIWEAKIRYNRIFRKELEGFEKSEQYGGNLANIERLLDNRITWNGIPIKNGYFDNLDKWDSEFGDMTSKNSPILDSNPILTTYVRNETRTDVRAVGNRKRRSRRNRYGYDKSNDRIICSPKSIIIIQDTEKPQWAKGLARYYLYKSPTPISQVYVLNFTNQGVKDEFIKEYNFETVPVIHVSQNELLIKTYLKSVRPERVSGINGEKRPLNCPFINISNRRMGQYIATNASNWAMEDVNAKGISGGYFVVYYKKTFVYKTENILHECAGNFWQSIYDLSKLSGVPIDKVYGIHPKFAESEWFKEAVENGDWINLADFVDENIDCLPMEDIKKLSAYLDAEEYRIGPVAAEQFVPLLNKVDGLAHSYLKEIVDLSQHMDLIHIPKSLRLDGQKYSTDNYDYFRNNNSEMKKRYPLLFKLNVYHNTIQNSDTRAVELSSETVNEFADYINLIDTK